MLASYKGQLALALSLVATTSHAALVLDFSGDLNAAPFFRGFALSGFDYDPDPSVFAIDNGLTYFNNTAPRTALVSATETKNGATMTSSAQSISGNYFHGQLSASMTVTNAQADDGYYTAAGFGSRSQVTFYAPPDAASVTYRWNISGTENIPVGSGGSRFDFLTAVAGTYTSWNDLDVPGPVEEPLRRGL